MGNKEERIQKLVANYGNYSRREFEQLIKKGKVKKNDKIVILGEKALINDKIEVNGKVIKLNLKHDYYLVNKPKGYISKRVDEQQKEVISLVPNWKERNLFTIGRLDVLTTGLIIVTNDGFLSNKVNKPNSKIKKIYLVFSQGKLSIEAKKQVKEGVVLDDGYKTKPANNFKVIRETLEHSTYRITISEGRKNQIKRMWKAVGSEVINLKRISIGSLVIDGIGLGQYKKLRQQEIYEKLGLIIEGQEVTKK